MVMILGMTLSSPAGAIAAAPVDCRVSVMPPAKYRSMPLPVKTSVIRVKLETLQKSYASVFKNPRPGTFTEKWCKWPIGLTFKVQATTFVVLPNDVSARCATMIEEHELAHAKGWKHGDAGSIKVSGGGSCGSGQ
jgi:hypothetical protein